MSAFRVDFNEVNRMVLGFLTQKPLFDLATTESIGGTLALGTFMDPIKNKSWFCRGGQPLGLPAFFLAFEWGDYNPAHVPATPQQSVLVRSTSTFTYHGEPNAAAVQQWLSTQTIALTEDADIDRKTVEGLLNKLPRDPAGKPYNKYACSYFESNLDTDLHSFINQNDIQGVRYYFGYDDTNPHYITTNRIRVILVAVDRQGANIVPSSTRPAESVWMLQRSWPPPPVQ